MNRDEPPRMGAGSSREAWVSYAQGLGLTVPFSASRADVIRQVDERKEAGRAAADAGGEGEPDPPPKPAEPEPAPPVEPEPAPRRPAPTQPGLRQTYRCEVHPELQVLVVNKNATGERIRHHIRFESGMYTTGDRNEIELLDRVPEASRL